MPAMASRSGSKRRRVVSEINMVPFIDVMLVLLIIFMVSAPLMSPGVVDLPSVGQAQRQPDRVIEVIIDTQEQLRLRVNGQADAQGAADQGQRIELPQLAARVHALQEGVANAPVVIAADKGVKYESVVKVMDTLQRSGVQRVGLAVRTTGA
jgi:biopolymer transport protein TolR